MFNEAHRGNIREGHRLYDQLLGLASHEVRQDTGLDGSLIQQGFFVFLCSSEALTLFFHVLK